MKETMERIRALSNSAPVIGKNSSYNDAEQCSMALNKINDLALDATRAVERNADGDGDTITRTHIQCLDCALRCVDPIQCRDHEAGPVGCPEFIRTKFDPHNNTSFEAWHESVIKKGLACERTLSNGSWFVYDHIDGLNLSYHCAEGDFTYLRAGFDPSDTWTAIPRPTAPDAGKADDARDSCDYKHACTTEHCLGVSAPCYDGPVKQVDAGKAMCLKCEEQTSLTHIYYQAGPDGDEPICGACLADENITLKMRLKTMTEAAEKPRPALDWQAVSTRLNDKYFLFKSNGENRKADFVEIIVDALQAGIGGGK